MILYKEKVAILPKKLCSKKNYANKKSMPKVMICRIYILYRYVCIGKYALICSSLYIPRITHDACLLCRWNVCAVHGCE